LVLASPFDRLRVRIAKPEYAIVIPGERRIEDAA
jgi:hypothetical protein